MLSIIKWEIWQRRWSVLWWCVGVTALIAVNLAFYPSFRDQQQQLNEAFSSIPESAVSFFSDTGDFMSPVGYLSSQIFYLMLPMLLGILAISLGSSLLAREEKEGTIELLLSRPISRTSLLAGKLLAGCAITTLVGFVALIVTVVLSKLVSIDVSLSGIALASIAALLLALSFGAVAFVITTFGKARMASVGLAALFALGGYIIASLIDLASWLKWPARLFPFDYYKPAEIMQGTYNWANALFLVCVIVAAVTISIISFRRRDIS